jgi:predicted ester cyclase
MSPDEHKAILREHLEVLFNQHRVDRTDETVAADYVDHALLPGQAPGLAGAKKKWAGYLAAFPDVRLTIEDMVAEGDKVAVAWTGEGTQQGSCWASRPPASASGSWASASTAWPRARSPSSGSSGTG